MGFVSLQDFFGSYNNTKPERTEREKYVLAHPELDGRTRNLIENGIAGEGMSKNEVEAAWGKPDRIEKTSRFDADEMWYYWVSWVCHTRVYFRENIIVKID